MDALRATVSVFAAGQMMGGPSTIKQARLLAAFAPSALAAFARIRDGEEPVHPDPSLELAAGFLPQLSDHEPDQATARALDVYFIHEGGAQDPWANPDATRGPGG